MEGYICAKWKKYTVNRRENKVVNEGSERMSLKETT